MTMSFRKYVAADAIGIAAMNAALNASYTSWMWSKLDPVTLTGANGIASDLAGTPVWIAVLATVFGTSAVRQKLGEGRVERPLTRVPGILSMLPQGIATRAASLGVISAAFLALPLWLMMQTSGVGAVSLTAAVLTKVAITVVLSLAIVPVVILAAVDDTQPRHRFVTA